MSDVANDLLVACGLVALLLVCLEVGFGLGKRAAQDADSRAGGQVGAVQGALLGLLGLLLGFSFAAAGSRFLERQDLIVKEANAIGTATLRADLLEPPHGEALRSALRDYTARRIAMSANLRAGVASEFQREIEGQHRRIWRAAMEGVRTRPETMVGVLPPVNEVIDLHTTRVAAGKKKLPTIVMGLLIACSAGAMGVIGYGSGLARKRRLPLTLPLALMISTALWITVDLDHPRAGLMRLSDAPLKALTFEAPPGE